jgi:hypothetical protein
MPGLWAQLASGEDAATVASGLANASYFANRARLARGSARLAALLLALLCGGSALEVLVLLDGREAAVEPWLVTGARLPLLAGNVTILWVVLKGARR